MQPEFRSFLNWTVLYCTPLTSTVKTGDGSLIDLIDPALCVINGSCGIPCLYLSYSLRCLNYKQTQPIFQPLHRKRKPPTEPWAADNYKLIISWRTGERDGRLPDRIAGIVTAEKPYGTWLPGLFCFGWPLGCPIQIPSKCDKTDQRTKNHRSRIQDKEQSQCH